MRSKKFFLVWLVPLFTLIHNIEEAMSMPAFLVRRNAALHVFPWELFPPMNYPQLLLALLIMTAAPFSIAGFVNRKGGESGLGMFLILSAQFMMLINVFVHFGIAVSIGGGYAPGLITALSINLPFSIYLLSERQMSNG